MSAPITTLLDPSTADLVPPPADLRVDHEAPADGAEAPQILLPSGEVSITDAARKIFGIIGKARNLFHRGGRVHQVVTDPDKSQRLEPVTPTQFRSLLETYGRLFAWRSGANGERVLKPSLCPKDTADALLESRPASELLPNVVTLSACPVLAKDGDEIRVLGPGWHPLGGGNIDAALDTPCCEKMP